MSQLPLFRPAESFRIEDPDARAGFGELGDGKVYVHQQKIVFAVQVAQKTGRPLLLQGPAGSGKSSLAPFVANTLGCRFYSKTVTARTQARDLMWEFDALGRLNDANVAATDDKARARVGKLHNYIEPSVLWWAFDPQSAEERGAGDPSAIQVGACRDPATVVAGDPKAVLAYPREGAVVLIDEIDKADPDVPNNLLEAFGSRRFTVDETRTEVVGGDPVPLIVITTNMERELPKAFLRRCIVLELEHKTEDELVEIATAHPDLGEDKDGVYRQVARKLVDLRKQAEKEDRRAPSTAEYLDALLACRALNIKPNSDSKDAQLRWQYLIEIALSKVPFKKQEKEVEDARDAP